jgi:hypothetical protein
MQNIMMRTFGVLVSAIFLLLPSRGSIGAANALLECKSVGQKRGELALSGDIPGDFAEFHLKLKSNTAELLMSDEKDRIYVIEDFNRQVFTIAVGREDDRNLQLYAIPGSIKARSGANRLLNARFDAILLEAPKPGYVGPVNYQSMLRGVKMSCTYKYSI